MDDRHIPVKEESRGDVVMARRPTGNRSPRVEVYDKFIEFKFRLKLPRPFDFVVCPQ